MGGGLSDVTASLVSTTLKQPHNDVTMNSRGVFDFQSTKWIGRRCVRGAWFGERVVVIGWLHTSRFVASFRRVRSISSGGGMEGKERSVMFGWDVYEGGER